jgi:signal peptidase I
MTDTAPAATEPQPSPPSLRRWGTAAVIIVLLAAVRTVALEPVRVHESSMLPTLHDGDALMIDTLTYRFRDPGVGDVVIVRVPGLGTAVVKRVVAVGGDTVGIENGRLVRNGAVVAEAYEHDPLLGYYWGPVRVPDGDVFLLGDNRPVSVDSRDFGPVPVGRVDGRLLLRVWPL